MPKVPIQKGKLKIVPTMKEMSAAQTKAQDAKNRKKKRSGQMPKIAKAK